MGTYNHHSNFIRHYIQRQNVKAFPYKDTCMCRSVHVHKNRETEKNKSPSKRKKRKRKQAIIENVGNQED